MECGRGCAVRNEVRLPLRETSEKAERAEAATRLKCSLDRVLGEPFKSKWVSSFVSCLSERMSKNEIRVIGGDVPVVFESSGFTNGRFCSS